VELDPEWLERLSSPMANPRVWFATGKLRSLGRPGTLDGTYDLVSLARTAWRGGAGKPDSPRWNRSAEIVSAPMTAALFRRALFDRVGLLDERFGSYLEDVDFGIRAGLAGFRGAYVPEAAAGHWGSATLGAWNPEAVRLISRNQVFLVWKYRPKSWLSKEGWSILVGQALWGFVALRNAGLAGFAAWVRGKIEGVRGRTNFAGEPVGGAVLAREQRKLRELQRETGADLYWRLYFALTTRRRI
jgi:GT2 family glycosyltransferase